MNILIPIAGQDSFFRPEEYFFPKPLVEVAGTPMIELAVRNLVCQFPQAHFIFIAQSEHCTKYSLDGMLRILTDGRCTIVRLDHQAMVLQSANGNINSYARKKPKPTKVTFTPNVQ